MSGQPEAILSIERIAVRFGGLVAISDMTFDVRNGEIVGLIGPNGAGKTTAFNVITGFQRPSSGVVRYRSRAVTGMKPHEIAKLGLVRTFQRTSVFQQRSVFQNVLTGLHCSGRSGLWDTMLQSSREKTCERELENAAHEILRFVGLEQRAGEQAGALPYGEQRLVGIALALATKPTTLLLDEPVSGMNHSETARAIKLIEKVSASGMTILLVEHDMQMVMQVCSRIVVLNYGRIIAEGTPVEIQNNSEVIRAYLGQEKNVLELRDLVCRYGEVTAVKGLSLKVEQGQLVALIGANGAGKTTTLRAISGLLAPVGGNVFFNGTDITHASARQILSLGIAHCPEGRHVFPQMTVAENLEMGCYLRTDREGIAQDFERMFEEFPRLSERREQQAGTLSGGEQQMLAIARGLMSRPKLIMFDEPSLGLAPNIVERTFEIINRIRNAGTTVLMVEQNALAALEMCDHAYLLESGSLALSGTGRELVDNPHVRSAYLAG